MAGVQTLKNGNKKIQFVAADGKRRSLYLGPISERQAQSIRGMVEDLRAAAMAGQSVKRSTSVWLQDECSPALHSKLAKTGLVAERVTACLGGYIDEFIRTHPGKESTKHTLRRAGKHLTGFFDDDREMRTITEAEVISFFAWMRQEREVALSENTARKTVSIARQVWKQAKRQGVVESEPFNELPATVKGNPKRMHFVTHEDTAELLAACGNDWEWALVIALARFGGLRIPSEIKPLLWEHVDWEQQRIKIHASKTEHHDNGGVRDIPIFAELRPFLEAAWENTADGEKYVVPTLRHHSNLGTQLKRIIKRAGLKPWPKVWQNMRSSRETELMREHSLSVVCRWIGNSPQVAIKHYDQSLDEDFARAASQAVQNAVQQSALPSGTEMQGGLVAPGEGDAKRLKNNPLQESASECSGLQGALDGRYRTRTYDLTGVNGAL